MNPNVIPLNNNSNDADLFQARVNGVSSESVLIDTGTGVVNAGVAFSCLVAPIAGDTVLVSVAGNEYFVLSVLKREQEQDMTLEFPADVTMASRQGKVSVVADQGIGLMTPSETRFTASRINCRSAELDLVTNRLHANATDIEAHSKNVSLHTNTLSTVAKQVSQKTDMLVRWVENVETLNIGNLVQRIRKNLTSHSNQAMITATKDMRIDAERIHMG